MTTGARGLLEAARCRMQIRQDNSPGLASAARRRQHPAPSESVPRPGGGPRASGTSSLLLLPVARCRKGGADEAIHRSPALSESRSLRILRGWLQGRVQVRFSMNLVIKDVVFLGWSGEDIEIEKSVSYLAPGSEI